MQDTDTGLFNEKPSDPTKFVHDPIHTTAHCMAALELFDAMPLTSAKALEVYLDKEKMEESAVLCERKKENGQAKERKEAEAH